MVHSTTPALEGKIVSSYFDVVTWEEILRANVFKDFFAGIKDIVGGRSAAYEEELQKAHIIAFEEMDVQAKDLGANGILGIDIDYENVDSSMLMVSISRTAVVVDQYWLCKSKIPSISNSNAIVGEGDYHQELISLTVVIYVR